MNTKFKVSALVLAVGIAATGWAIAQNTPDGQAATIHAEAPQAPVPAFMQAMEAGPVVGEVVVQAPQPVSAPTMEAMVPHVAPEAPAPGVSAEAQAPAMGAAPPSSMQAPVIEMAPTQPQVSEATAPHRATLTPKEEAFFREQATLQQQTQLMASRVQLMEQKVRYEEAMRKLMEVGPAASMPAPAVPAAEQEAPQVASAYDAHIATDEKALSEMTLVSVYGEGRNLVGELFYRGGRMAVTKGDLLPGEWRVASIEPTRVMARKGKRRFEIGLGSPQTGAAAIVNAVQ